MMMEHGCCGGGSKDNETGRTECCKSGKESGNTSECCESKDGGCGCAVSSACGLTPNIGKTERIVRLIVGVGLIALVFVGPKTPWGWIGLIPLLTALTGWCALYALTGGHKKSCCGGAEKQGEQKGESCCSGDRNRGGPCCS